MINKKILVVEDEESIRKTFALILNKKYKIYSARDGREALQRIKSGALDLVIVDLKLPDTSGVELVAAFREAGYKGQAILISAFPDLVEIGEMTRLGIGHFFVKPLDLDVLSRAIDILLTPREEREKRL
ncbi:MAG: response regulator [Candidatus Aminicenantes bacterium]|nr:response regulator [Candidatus Aminicenantes bacterium]